jgi:hypothetical protein
VNVISWHDILTSGAGVVAVLAPLVPIVGWWVARRLERFKHELAEDHAKRRFSGSVSWCTRAWTAARARSAASKRC